MSPRKMIYPILIVLVICATGLPALAQVEWCDGFESYAVGSKASPPWIESGNTPGIAVDGSIAFSGTKSFRMYGTLGSCWAAVADRQYSGFPITVSMAVRNGTESLSGCHKYRGACDLRTGCGQWQCCPCPGVFRFLPNGDFQVALPGANATFPGYALNVWHFVKFSMSLPGDGSLHVRYWVNEEYLGEYTIPEESWMSSPAYLDISAQEGTAWFDDVCVAQLEELGPECWLTPWEECGLSWIECASRLPLSLLEDLCEIGQKLGSGNGVSGVVDLLFFFATNHEIVAQILPCISIVLTCIEPIAEDVLCEECDGIIDCYSGHGTRGLTGVIRNPGPGCPDGGSPKAVSTEKATIQIVDSAGRMLQRMENGSVVADIPKSYLFGINVSTDLFIIDSATDEYDIHIRFGANASLGDYVGFGLIQPLTDGADRIIEFDNVPTVPNAHAFLSSVSSSWRRYVMHVDLDGDGNVDQVLTPSSTSDSGQIDVFCTVDGLVPLADVTVRILDAANNQVESIVTGGDGWAHSSRLMVGEYQVNAVPPISYSPNPAEGQLILDETTTVVEYSFEHLLSVSVDIKPQGCPNPFELKPDGTPFTQNDEVDPFKVRSAAVSPSDNSVLPMAVVGSNDFDVTRLDPLTIMLNGVRSLRWAVEDVATPIGDDADECECTVGSADGYMDLTLKFDRAEIAATLGPVNDGDFIPLVVTGELIDGTHFEGTDCIWIRLKGKGRLSGANDNPYGLESFPNPFNASTTIRYNLSEPGEVELSIYNVLGQRVVILAHEYQESGSYARTWDASDVASGMYFYRLQVNGTVVTRKMTLLK